MIKKIVLLSLLGFSLTGCVVAPYDDRPNYSGHYSGGYASSNRPHWNNGIGHRPDYRPNNRPNIRPNYRPYQQSPSHRPPLQGQKPPLYRPNGHVSTKPYPSVNKPRPNQSVQKPKPNRPNVDRKKSSWNSIPSRPSV